MRRRKQKKQSSGAPKWMVTFSDLVTLILVFFILLFSMSQIDLVKFKAVAESFNQVMVFDNYPSVVPFENPTNSPDIQREIEDVIEELEEKQNSTSDQEENQNNQDGELDSLGKLMQEVNQFLEENGLGELITANRTERGVILVLQERVLFNSGQAEILDRAEPFMDKVGTLLSNIPNPIKVEGHTDNLPISTFKFSSNWELSGARAGSVIRYLTQEFGLDEERFSLVGYADTRPVASNDTADGRQKNRRVEIVITDLNYNENQ